jgi:ribosome-associated protein
VASPGHDPAGGSRPAEVAAQLPITLGQFLKLAGLVSTGGEAKELIVSGLVLVNGQVETRRGRKMAPGDTVHVEGATARLLEG